VVNKKKRKRKRGVNWDRESRACKNPRVLGRKRCFQKAGSFQRKWQEGTLRKNVPRETRRDEKKEVGVPSGQTTDASRTATEALHRGTAKTEGLTRQEVGPLQRKNALRYGENAAARKMPQNSSLGGKEGISNSGDREKESKVRVSGKKLEEGGCRDPGCEWTTRWGFANDNGEKGGSGSPRSKSEKGEKQGVQEERRVPTLKKRQQ